MFVFAGYPDPEVIWLFDEAPLEKSGRVQMNYDNNGICTLTLDHVQPGDSGIYKCCASNNLGQALCSARLTVGTYEVGHNWENVRNHVQNLLEQKHFKTILSYIWRH